MVSFQNQMGFVKKVTKLHWRHYGYRHGMRINPKFHTEVNLCSRYAKFLKTRLKWNFMQFKMKDKCKLKF